MKSSEPAALTCRNHRVLPKFRRVYRCFRGGILGLCAATAPTDDLICKRESHDESIFANDCIDDGCLKNNLGQWSEPFLPRGWRSKGAEGAPAPRLSIFLPSVPQSDSCSRGTFSRA